MGRKRRKRHKKSILMKKDGTCYLCRMLHNNARIHLQTEEHHIFFGIGQRWKSEEDGMKVYLCIEHHRTGPEAVHMNSRICRKLQRAAQLKYEETHTRDQFRQRYGRSYVIAEENNLFEELTGKDRQ